MIELSELECQLTLTLGDMRDLVALTNLAAEHLPEGQVPDLVTSLSGQYFDLMEELANGYFGSFKPE